MRLGNGAVRRKVCLCISSPHGLHRMGRREQALSEQTSSALRGRGPGKGEDRTGEEVETEEVGKEEEALGEVVLLVQEFLCPPTPCPLFVASCCQKLLLGLSCHPELLALRSPALWAAARLAGAAASI